MITVDVEQQQEEADFARMATEHFRDNCSHYTFSDGDPSPGKLFAIRWNSFAILVVRLSSEHSVLNYASHQFIRQDFPPLTPSRPLPDAAKYEHAATHSLAEMTRQKESWQAEAMRFENDLIRTRTERNALVLVVEKLLEPSLLTVIEMVQVQEEARAALGMVAGRAE